jgi:hypothetical protein
VARLLVRGVVVTATVAAGPPHTELAALRQLVRQLGSDDFVEREKASRALDQLGEPALPALRQALGSRDPEVRRRAEEVYARLRARRQEKLAAAMRALGGDLGVLTPADRPPEQWLLFPATAGDAHVAHVASLPGAGAVAGVALSRTRVTDACLPHLARFHVLRHLLLSKTAVTGRGLARLRGLELRTLHLDGTAVGDTELAAVGHFPSLTRLNLASTGVTDGGLASMRELPRLTHLDLQMTAVTDRGLVKLRGMPGLIVDLEDTQVSSAIAAEFQRPFACVLPGSRP